MGDAGPWATLPGMRTFTSGSAITRLSVLSTYWAESPGSTRQFTLAAASCGRTLMACPPSILRSDAGGPQNSVPNRRSSCHALYGFLRFLGHLR
jgi:hypothetical protein